MDERDYRSLIQYMERRLRALGMPDVADRVTAQIGPDPGPPSQQLLHMLRGLEREIRLQDGEMARMIVERLNAVARTEDGRPIQGMWLDLAPAHQDLFGTDAVDLSAGRDMDELLGDVRELHDEISEDDPGWR